MFLLMTYYAMTHIIDDVDRVKFLDDLESEWMRKYAKKKKKFEGFQTISASKDFKSLKI